MHKILRLMFYCVFLGLLVLVGSWAIGVYVPELTHGPFKQFDITANPGVDQISPPFPPNCSIIHDVPPRVVCDMSGHALSRIIISGINGGPNGITRDPLKKIMQLGQILKSLPIGHVVLVTPSAMRVGETREAEASVTLEPQSPPLPKSDTTVSTGKLKVSPEMIATLEGAGFGITAITPERQSIADGFKTVWTWHVEAKEKGKQELKATVYALVNVVEKETRQRIDSYSKIIEVGVREKTWNEWLKDLSEGFDSFKALAVGLGGAATVVFGWLGIARAKKGKKSSGAKQRKSLKDASQSENGGG